MNNIHEMDWAEESWASHTGMDSFSDYCGAGDKAGEVLKDTPEAAAEHDDIPSAPLPLGK